MTRDTMEWCEAASRRADTGVIAFLLSVLAEAASYGRTARDRWHCHREGAHRDWRNLVRLDESVVLCRKCGERWVKGH